MTAYIGMTASHHTLALIAGSPVCHPGQPGRRGEDRPAATAQYSRSGAD